MTEQDYMLVADIGRLRIIVDALRTLTPGHGAFADGEYNIAVGLAQKMLDECHKAVQSMELTPDMPVGSSETVLTDIRELVRDLPIRSSGKELHAQILEYLDELCPPEPEPEPDAQESLEN